MLYYRKCLTVIYKKQANKKLIGEVLNNNEVRVRSVEMPSVGGMIPTPGLCQLKSTRFAALAVQVLPVHCPGAFSQHHDSPVLSHLCF